MIIEQFQNGIYVFIGFMMGIIYGMVFGIFGLSVFFINPIISGFFFLIMLFGILFIWGLLKKDKIEERKDK